MEKWEGNKGSSKPQPQQRAKGPVTSSERRPPTSSGEGRPAIASGERGAAGITTRSYIEKQLRQNDEEGYKAGGVMLLRKGPAAGQYFALMGTEYRDRKGSGLKVLFFCLFHPFKRFHPYNDII